MKPKTLTSFLLITLISFFGTAFIFNLISPPVYGQADDAWNIHRQAADNLNFYYGINGQPALQLLTDGNMQARRIFDIEDPSYFLDPHTLSKMAQIQANSLSVLSGNDSIATTIDIGRGAADGKLAVAASPGQYASGTDGSDIILRSESGKLYLNSGQSDSDIVISGNSIGIGTSTPSPTHKLDVNGNILISSGTNATMFLGSASANAGGFALYNGSALALGEVGNGAALFVDAGKVGIGVSAPVSKLHLAQSANTNAGGLRTYATGGSTWSAMYTGADNYSYLSNYAGGYVRVDAAGNTGTSGALYLGTGITCLNGAAHCPIGGLLMGWSGHTQVNSPSGGSVLLNFNNGSVPPNTAQLQVGNGTNGVIFRVFADGSVSTNGPVSVNGTALTSDERVKKNIQVIPDALSKVLQLRGVTFDYRDDIPNQTFPKGRAMGLIAQEVEKVAPETVSTNISGYKGISYDSLVGLLAEGIKEQQTEINDLKKQVQELKEVVSQLQETN